MGSIWIREFTGGLDTRRLPETSAGGVLIEARDGHITRGGEFEQRAAFVPEFTLPAGTLGLAYDRTGPVVFGSDPEPAGMPAGIGYRRIQHPAGTKVSRILSTDLYAGKLYVAAELVDGGIIHFYDGTYVKDWYDGRARAAFSVAGGETGATVRVLVDGVPASGVVAWVGSNTATAAAIADSVNTMASVPEYVASVATETVSVAAASPGPEANGRSVTFEVTGALDITSASGLVFRDGVTVAGTFQPGTFVRTVGSKVYSASGPNLHFSGIQQPTKWTTGATGAGFVDMSSETSGAEELVALAKYQGYVAIFAERVIQIWYVDPDPALNKQAQVLNNTGTISPRSVTQFGDSDLFYLAESGLRSLRARDSSNAAATTDIGSPVDELVAAAVLELSDLERSRVIGLIEPRDGRFWLIVGERIFVFSYFSGAQVSAWSTYTPGFAIEDATVVGRRVYLRSGDTVYVYGGLGDVPVHDDTPAIARTPFLDADAPAVVKPMRGVDAALRGKWDLSVGFDPNRPDAHDLVGTLDQTTFGLGHVPLIGAGAHVSLTLTSRGKGPHRLGSLVLHYESGEDAR